MSLILEALRKSEAERRRGQAPSLYSELPLPARNAPHRRPWPWLLAGLALVIAVIGWWRPAPPAPTAQTTAAATTEPPAALPNAAPRFVEAPPMPAPAPTVETIAATPQTPAQDPPPAPASVPSPVIASAEPPPTAEPATIAEAHTLELAELDPASRAALPPLRLSMHVWHEQPAQRFAIVDGQRVGEGDRLGDAVVEGIEPDGLRLFWRGQRLRLARP